MASSLPSPIATTPAGEPRCGRCGYIVRGISSLTCPECGGDLREVGIDLGHSPRPGWAPVIGLAILWALLVVIFAFTIGEAMERNAPRLATRAFKTTFQQPGSGAYNELLIEGEESKFVGRPGAVVEAQVIPNAVLTINGPNGTLGTLVVDLAENRFSETTGAGPVGEPSQPFHGESTLLDWMRRSTGSSDAKLQGEAKDVLAIIRSDPDQHSRVLRYGDSRMNSSGGSSWGRSGSWTVAEATGNFASGSGAHSVFYSTPYWYSILLAVGALMLWLLGLRWLARRFGPSAKRSREVAGSGV